MLVGDERVRLITFTGSERVGWWLQERAPRKRVRLELGNSTPVLVAADADLERAASRIAAGAFSFAGQSCVSVQRVYVQEAVYGRFLELFLAEVARLRTGHPAGQDPEVDVGPVIDSVSRDRLLAWIEEAVVAGATVLAGSGLRDGLLAPTVLADVPARVSLACEEAFGPGARASPAMTSWRRRSRRRTRPATGCRQASSPLRWSPRLRLCGGSRSPR